MRLGKLFILGLLIVYILFIWATWTILVYFGSKANQESFQNKKMFDLALTLLSTFWPITFLAILAQVVIFNFKRICKRSK